MLDKHTVTNLLLFLIAGALLIVVAQGGLDQLSSFVAAISGAEVADETGELSTGVGNSKECG